jgi:hypothetical protein
MNIKLDEASLDVEMKMILLPTDCIYSTVDCTDAFTYNSDMLIKKPILVRAFCISFFNAKQFITYYLLTPVP